MFTTLVLSAANIHGVMYAGAFRYLFEHDMHARINTVVGSSSGALLGFMFVAGLSYDEMANTFINIFCNIGIPCISFTRLFMAWASLGVIGSQWKKEYIRLIIKKQFGKSDINFTDLAKLTGKNLIVVGSNITTQKAEYFSVDTTPTMSVIEALDITTCIPIAFKPVLYRDCLYVDGAVYNYLPTDIVTDKNTLVLYAPLLPKTDAPKNLYQFVRDILMSLIYIKFQENTTRFPKAIPLVSKECAISVDNITFKQKIITFPKASFVRLLDEGYEQTRAYFEWGTDVPHYPIEDISMETDTAASKANA